jgi:hypothetical protein
MVCKTLTMYIIFLIGLQTSCRNGFKYVSINYIFVPCTCCLLKYFAHSVFFLQLIYPEGCERALVCVCVCVCVPHNFYGFFAKLRK